MAQQEIHVHPLFVVLTRPAMMLGVTLNYFCVCVLMALCVFILADNFIYLACYIPMHIVGWLACKWDVNFFQILFKALECSYSPNKKYWGCHAYEPF